MSIHGKISRAQTNFLRTFHQQPGGPAQKDWPSPAILRRWLRKPGFLLAMRTLRDALRYQMDFQLLSSAATASQVLHEVLSQQDCDEKKHQIAALAGLLRLAHLRERFPTKDPSPVVRDSELVTVLKTAHPDIKVSEARELYRRICAAEPEMTHPRIVHTCIPGIGPIKGSRQ